MTLGVSTRPRRSGELRLPVRVGSPPVGRLSVTRGSYIATATCSLRTQSRGSTIVTLGLTVGSSHQEQQVTLHRNHETHIAAITVGGTVDGRSDILLTGTVNNMNKEVFVTNLSITAIQVDELYFDRMPLRAADFVSTVLNTIRRLFGFRRDE